MNYQLYLVTNRYHFSDDQFLNKIDQACAAGVTLVQLREKEVTTRRYYELARKVKIITDYYHLPLIIDDRIDICQAIDAAGVHIGDAELPVTIARRILGTHKILGVSAKTPAAAQAAMRAGADYLGVGAIYPTTTKVITQLTSIDTLIAITNTVTIPVVAIGGITDQRLVDLNGIKLAGVAMISEIMQAENITAKVKTLKRHLKEVGY